MPETMVERGLTLVLGPRRRIRERVSVLGVVGCGNVSSWKGDRAEE